MNTTYSYPSISSSGVYTGPIWNLDHFTDEIIIEEVKRRKLMHPDILDGWQKAKKIKQLEETIEKSQKELEIIKAGEK